MCSIGCIEDMKVEPIKSCHSVTHMYLWYSRKAVLATVYVINNIRRKYRIKQGSARQARAEFENKIPKPPAVKDNQICPDVSYGSIGYPSLPLFVLRTQRGMCALLSKKAILANLGWALAFTKRASDVA